QAHSSRHSMSFSPQSPRFVRRKFPDKLYVVLSDARGALHSVTMEIRIDDLKGPAVIQLLHAHLQSMVAQSPPESVHALDLDGLRQPDITFWSAWQGSELMGCGALKELGPR